MFTKLLAIIATLTGFSTIDLTLKKPTADKGLTNKRHQLVLAKNKSSRTWEIHYRIYQSHNPELVKHILENPVVHKNVITGEYGPAERPDDGFAWTKEPIDGPEEAKKLAEKKK